MNVLLLHSGARVLENSVVQNAVLSEIAKYFYLHAENVESVVWVLKTQYPCLIIESSGEQGHPAP